MKKSELLIRNYNWLMEDELESVEKKISDILEKYEIELVKEIEMLEYCRYVLIGDEKMYLFMDGVEDDVFELILNEEEIKVLDCSNEEEVSREDLIELLMRGGEVEVECII